MTVSKYQFRVELQRLVERYIGPSSTFEDYYLISEELEQALIRFDRASDKFSDEEVDAHELDVGPADDMGSERSAL